jgi:hypothetical protein
MKVIGEREQRDNNGRSLVAIYPLANASAEPSPNPISLIVGLDRSLALRARKAQT